MEKIDLLKMARDHCDECYLSNVNYRNGNSKVPDTKDRDKARKCIQELKDNNQYMIRLSGILGVCEGCEYTEPRVGDVCNELYRSELTRDADKRDRDMKTCGYFVHLVEALNRE